MDESEVRIKERCFVDWGSIEGDGIARFCSSCNKHVFDLSERTEAQARDLIAAAERRGQGLCARYSYDADGEAVFRDRKRLFSQISVVRKLVAVAMAIPLSGALTLGGVVAGGHYGLNDYGERLGDALPEAVKHALGFEEPEPEISITRGFEF